MLPALLGLAAVTGIDAEVHLARKLWNVPGCAVVLVRADRVTHCQGYGLRRAGGDDLVTPATLFPLSSCTKGFTTAAMAQLVGEGKLTWDDPVRDHLPDFRLSDPLVERDVRLRDLLCHRTGLGAHELLWRGAPWGPDEAVRRLRFLPLDRPFRTEVRYQSTAFAAAGLAAAAADGCTWSEQIQRRLLDPLGMKSTCTHYRLARGRELATGHRLDRAGTQVVLPRDDPDHADPAISIYSCATDLGTWLRFHLAQGKPLPRPGPLAQTHAGQMISRLSLSQKALFPDTAEVRYALGWAVHDYRGLTVVSHGGAIDGFRVHLAFVPSRQVGVAVLCNLEHTPMPLALANILLDRELGFPRRDWHAIHRTFHQAAAKEPPQPLPGAAPTLPPAAYTGDFDHPAYGTVRIGLTAGRLVWRWRGEELPLEHLHLNTFAVSSDLLGFTRVHFTLDAAGSVARLETTGRLGTPFRKLRSNPR
ncbi:MAG: serine hydrolase [Gemmataceae bacterium]